MSYYSMSFASSSASMRMVSETMRGTASGCEEDAPMTSLSVSPFLSFPFLFIPFLSFLVSI